MKKVKQIWILTRLNNGNYVVYTDMDKLSENCKQLLSLNQDDKYRIEYLENGVFIERVKMSDYFTPQPQTPKPKKHQA